MRYGKFSSTGKDIVATKALSALGLLLAMATSACLSVEEPQTGLVQTGNGTVIGNAPANRSASGQICDPFGNPSQQGSDLDHGLVGELKYLSDDQPRYSRASDYKINAHPVEATLFFGDLNVPTRAFDRGFTMTSGQTIMNGQGTTLYEYFSLHFDSVLKLMGNDDPGQYQLALLSDDGALLQVDTGNGFRTLINNDGTHPTKMGCTSELINFDFMTKVPMKVDYYQGPRYHISLMLLWRKYDPNAGFPLVDPSCGTSGNTRFFDSSVFPSQPRQAYLDMLARGWKPVPAANFTLPQEVVANPCATASAPKTQFAAIAPAEAFTRETSISFELSSDTPGAVFSCALDGAPLGPCESIVTFSGLADGSHTFRAYAEANGITDLEGAVHQWTVDTTFPAVISTNRVVGSDNITINWATNKATTTGLNWGVGVDLSNVVAQQPPAATSHSITLTGLQPNTVYSYQMTGTDQVGNVLVTSRFTFRTNP